MRVCPWAGCLGPHRTQEPAEATLLAVYTGELVRLVLADKKAAGITITEERAREQVAFTLSLLRRFLTSEPLPARPKAGDRQLGGPHCSHKECGTGVCQNGYAWHVRRKPGCPVCGGPPNNTPKHWAGDIVAHAAMTPADLERAEAHLKAYSLLRRRTTPRSSPTSGLLPPTTTRGTTTTNTTTSHSLLTTLATPTLTIPTWSTTSPTRGTSHGPVPRHARRYEEGLIRPSARP
ncbi:hypothetical protein ABZ897_42815 [Nonomuraea sp. NPDC046802]|uniref:hypothetical protein n=1 Tax=Nonomuraea sp. NPDC046802 TaxID=3154919 RepID=UPI00340F1628